MNQILGLISKDKITKFEQIRELNAEEYNEYKNASTNLIRFSRDQQLFTIVQLNYNDYMILLNQYLIEYIENPSINLHQMDKMFCDVNRNLLNFLCAVRTFLDHSETNLNKRMGNDSPQFKRFKEATNISYDTHFSYRFLYHLRNYAQHCGMPVGELNMYSELTNPITKEASDSLLVKFDRDELLKYDKWKNQLKNEIKELPSKFEITPLVTDMLKCLERINFTIIENDLNNLAESTEYLQKLISPFKDKGIPCIFSTSETDSQLKIEWMPLHIIEQIDEYLHMSH